ncbi:MAG: hypothetical protein QM756_11060 [Polyangiaceae bacterium]
MINWLLRGDVAQELQASIRSGARPTAAQRAEFASRQAAAGSAPRNLRIAGDVAEIRVEGLLTQRADFLAMFFGFANTTYSAIAEAFAIAGADPNVKRVSLSVDSPGGTVAGLFDALAAIESFSKPISVIAEQACSAAYSDRRVSGPNHRSKPSERVRLDRCRGLDLRRRGRGRHRQHSRAQQAPRRHHRRRQGCRTR